MRKLFAVILLAVGLSACYFVEAPTALTSMLVCRKSFDDTLDTFSTVASNLSAEKRLEIVLKAISDRNHCEQATISSLKKLAKDR